MFIGGTDGPLTEQIHTVHSVASTPHTVHRRPTGHSDQMAAHVSEHDAPNTAQKDEPERLRYLNGAFSPPHSSNMQSYHTLSTVTVHTGAQHSKHRHQSAKWGKFRESSA